MIKLTREICAGYKLELTDYKKINNYTKNEISCYYLILFTYKIRVFHFSMLLKLYKYLVACLKLS